MYPDYALPQKFQDRRWLHVTLFVATCITTTLAGAGHYLGFLADYGPRVPSIGLTRALSGGLWYSATILLILGAHELGHYIACRYYQVDASRPFFLPLPIGPTGTLGAFIRIREPIPTKQMLFDIGAAGPFAGFVFAVPALFLGIAMSHVTKVPAGFEGVDLGEPLLFKAASYLVWGTIPDGYSINMHPMAFAAWFGLLATAINLFPAGQLDGGHISYAVLGRKSSNVTVGAVATAICLAYFSTTWVIWSTLMLVMMYTTGRHHPRTSDEETPLDPARRWLALAALIVFVLCFTYAPMQTLK